MNKINLTEATVLALQGKLLLDDHKTIKHESVDITANNGTFVSIDDNSTIISSPEASITLVNSNNDANAEVPVATDLELPVESDETIIPEDSIAEDTFTDEIVPDDSIENIDDENMNESIDTTKDFNITKYNEVMNLASDIANSLKDSEHLNLNDVIKAIENWDGGDTSVFTVIAKVDPELYKKLDNHTTENEDNRYEVENQFLGLVEDCLADMGKTVFDDDYYTESKKADDCVKTEYLELDDEETKFINKMVNKDRAEIEDFLGYELTDATFNDKQRLRLAIKEIYEQMPEEELNLYERKKENKYKTDRIHTSLAETKKLEDVPNLKFDVLSDREINLANQDLYMILDDVKDNSIRPATIKSAEALLSNLIFWFKEANPDYNYKFDYIGESKKICNKPSKKLHESEIIEESTSTASAVYGAKYFAGVVIETAENLDSLNGNNTYTDIINDENKLNLIVDSLLDDDEMWNTISESVTYYLDAVKSGELTESKRINHKKIENKKLQEVVSAYSDMDYFKRLITEFASALDDSDSTSKYQNLINNKENLEILAKTLKDDDYLWEIIEDTIKSYMDDLLYESRKKDEEDEEDTEDDDLDEAKSVKRNPKVNIASFENKLNEFYAKNNAKVRLDSVAMSSDHIKLEGVLQITDKSARRLCLEMKQLNTFKNKQSYILESTGRTIKKESQQSRVVMTITNNNGVLECSNIFNRKNK